MTTFPITEIDETKREIAALNKKIKIVEKWNIGAGPKSVTLGILRGSLKKSLYIKELEAQLAAKPIPIQEKVEEMPTPEKVYPPSKIKKGYVGD